MWNGKAARWWHVLRYHRPSQLAMRLASVAHVRFGRSLWNRRLQRPSTAIPRIRNHAGLASLAQQELAARRGEPSRAAAHRVLTGRYCFLQHELALPDPVDWRLESAPKTSHLWRFHLHYHDYLLDLAAEAQRTGDPQWTRRAWNLVVDWIDNNRLDDPRVLRDAWHPYCIARRLPVWIALWSAAPPDEPIRARVLRSMLAQARYLEGHLEWDLGGNHLLEDLRALVLIGAFFEGSEAQRRLRKTAALFKRQLVEQILPHGEHFERSPMYHAQMLQAVLDVRDAVTGLQPELADICRNTAAKMAPFLANILHPDGDIPLLGDSCLGQHIPLDPPIEHPAKPADGPAQVGDYWTYRHADDFLLFDAGPVGPDHLPAHAHADLLNLEISIRGRRLIVDSGVYDYADSSMRRYCRSSAAHNVLQIDGTDQCDMWSRFRMGARGWPSPLVTGQHAGFSWAAAAHNAYRRLGVAEVGRWLACRPGGPWFCVDRAQGHGQHQVTSLLHFHPDVTLRPADDEIHVLFAGNHLRLHWLTPGRVTIDQYWYCPHFGQRQPAPVARWEQSCQLTTQCGWCLAWEDIDHPPTLLQTAAGQNILRWTQRNETIEFPLQFRPTSQRHQTHSTASNKTPLARSRERGRG